MQEYYTTAVNLRKSDGPKYIFPVDFVGSWSASRINITSNKTNPPRLISLSEKRWGRDVEKTIRTFYPELKYEKKTNVASARW